MRDARNSSTLKITCKTSMNNFFYDLLSKSSNIFSKTMKPFPD